MDHLELPTVATWLARSGLLPFITLPFLIAFDLTRATLWIELLRSYSLGILCFLLGAWWGLALIRRHTSALWLSNALFLVNFFGYLILPANGYLVLAAMLFVALVVIEKRHPLFHLQPPYYAHLRLMLSATASLALFAGAVLTGAAID